MPRLNPADVQILLLEMQPPIVAASQTVAPDALTRSATTLMTAARSAGLPVTASVVPLGEDAPTLIGELADVPPMIRSVVGAFDDATILASLAANGRHVLAVGGISSEIAVLHAVLGARAEGYEVHVLLDLCGGLDSRSEHAAFEQMWSAGAVPSNVSSFATALFSDLSQAPGQSIMQALDRHWGWSAHADAEATPSIAEPRIEELLETMQAAWRDGDAEAFASVFSEDARFVAFDGTVLNGPGEIAAYHAAPFSSYLAGTELRFDKLSVHPAGTDIYLVASEGGIVRDGQREGQLIGRSAQTFVMRKTQDGLRIVAFHNTRVRPIDGPRAAEVWKSFDDDWSRMEAQA